VTSRAAPRRLLVAGVGLCFTSAFVSAYFQVGGLLGPRGIAPAAALLSAVRERWGPWEAAWAVPTVLWLGAGNGALAALCVAGALAGGVAAVGLCPRWALGLAWLLHLSLVTVGSVFWHFQWDALLSEAGLLALLVAPGGLRPVWARSPPRVSWWLVQLLVVRLMVASGLVKLLSGDVAWRNLSALRYHLWTQPLPTPLGIWLARAPVALLDGLCALTLVVEVVAPLLAFGPRALRRLAVLALALLQLGIALTGNYGFFNLLSLVLLLAFLDDRDLGWVGRWALRGRRPVAAGPSGWPLRLGAGALALLGLSVFVEGLGGPVPLAPVVEALAPFQVVNRYGLFAIMTTRRDEIGLDVSDDGRSWRHLRFRDKPDDRGASWVAPDMPRLDWQMWFAALGPCRSSPWFLAFARRLLEGEPAVWQLLATPPPATRPRLLRSVRRAALPPEAGKRWPMLAEASELFCPALMLRDGRLVAVDVGPPGFEPGTNRL
jgi:lipase maturation factor 1